MKNIVREHNTKRFTKSLIFSVFSLPFITIPFMYYKLTSSFMHKRITNPVDVSSNLKGLNYEKVSFKSKKDGTTLSGIFIPSITPSSKTLIVVHGLYQNKLLSGYTKKLSEYLTPRGYNILSFDLRCHGESEGSLITFGYCEKYDVIGAIDYLKQQSEYGEKIALLGFSMGAATVIEAAGRDPRVDAVIADSPYRDLRLYILNDLMVSLSNGFYNYLPGNIAGSFYWPAICRFPFKDKFIKLISRLYNINLDDICPMNTVKNISTKPVFIIHSKDDMLIPYTNSETIYKPLQDSPSSMLWITEKAGHIESLEMYPEEYLKRLKMFLDNNV